MYTLMVEPLIEYCEKVDPKQLGLTLAHFFGLSILLLQVFIERVEFFKNSPVGQSQKFLIWSGNAVSFPGKQADIRRKRVVSPWAVYCTVIGPCERGLEIY
jgi:hypothetical protein